jgi:hypothetical protein
MKKPEIRKLTVTRETLRRLEERRLQTVAGQLRTTGESICYCDTDVCASLNYTICDTCTCM